MSKHYSQNLNQLPRNSVNMDNKGLVRQRKSSHKLGSDNAPVYKLRERWSCRLESGRVDSLGGRGDKKDTKVEVQEHCGGGGEGHAGRVEHMCWCPRMFPQYKAACRKWPRNVTSNASRNELVLGTGTFDTDFSLMIVLVDIFLQRQKQLCEPTFTCPETISLLTGTKGTRENPVCHGPPFSLAEGS